MITHRLDVPLIVGSGVAGLSVALSLPAAAVMTRTALGPSGSTAWAQGGVAVALGADDHPNLHAEDTLAVSGGLGDPEAVQLLAADGPAAIRRLVERGARFDQADDGTIARGQEAGHRRRRIVHADGDSTGAEISRALAAATQAAGSITIMDHTRALDLVRSAGRVVGVLAVDQDGRHVIYLAPAVVLATGGIGHLYAHTTNPPEVTGDGIAMATRAGAVLADMEFVQFHPTALAAGSDPMPLLTEALRGEGALLVDDAGHRFMVDEHPDAELAPRDVVARANWRQMQAGRKIYLDARDAIGRDFPQRFPTVFGIAQEHGLDPRVDLLPVSPAAHYFMGGIAVDARGRSSLPGLWAVGEASSTGVHGANRLASNSLLEGLIFGERVARDVMRSTPPRAGKLEVIGGALQAAPDRPESLALLRRRMWSDVGIVRSGDRLTRFLSDLAGSNLWDMIEGRNAALIARSIAMAALARTESRGAHYRSDYPHSNPGQAVRRRFTAVDEAERVA